jgi:hypothetical protein
MDSLSSKHRSDFKNQITAVDILVAAEFSNLPLLLVCAMAVLFAHGMDRVGENFTVLEAYLRWVGRTIQKYGDKVADIRQRYDLVCLLARMMCCIHAYTWMVRTVQWDSAWGKFSN